MKKILKTFFNVLTDILLIVALTILVLSAYTAHQYKEDPQNAYLFGYKPILVLTGSMEPTMRVNSICVAKTATYDDVEVGDIIMYEIEDKLITHRIVEITADGIRTKGDNNNTEDAYYITENNIRAKVIYIANWTATIINDLGTTQGKIKWIGFPIFVIVVLGALIYVIKRILRTPDEDESLEELEENNDVDSSLVHNLDEVIPVEETTNDANEILKATDEISGEATESENLEEVYSRDEAIEKDELVSEEKVEEKNVEDSSEEDNSVNHLENESKEESEEEPKKSDNNETTEV